MKVWKKPKLRLPWWIRTEVGSTNQVLNESYSLDNFALKIQKSNHKPNCLIANLFHSCNF